MAPETPSEFVHRTTMRRVAGSMERPKRRPEEIQCMTAYVSINGIKAYAMLDSGSTTDAMSNEFARVANVPLYELEKQLTLKLGCVGSRSKINYGTKVITDFADSKTSTYFDVANIDQYDVILGLPYMYRNGIVLDIPKQQIVVRGKIRISPIPRGEERPVPPPRQYLPGGKYMKAQ